MTVATEMTADELLALPDDGSRYELVRGELRKMSPVGTDHAAVVTRILVSLHIHVQQHRLGEAYAELGFRLTRDPETVRAPDVSFVRTERITRGPKFFDGAPDIAFEVVSPGDTYTEIDEKRLEYLRAGTRVVVIVNPQTHSVHVHRANGSAPLSDVLEVEDVVPGWKLPFGEMFG